MIETIDAATSVLVAVGVSRPELTADRREDERELADLRQRDGHGERHADGWRSAHTISSATSGLADQDDRQRAGDQRRELEQRRGSSSMPTDTKNSTAKASRIGSASEAARRLNSDRPTTMPARNAPSAIDTPKTSDAPTAMPSAMTSTVSVNSSRERVRGDAIEQRGNDPRADQRREGDQRRRP